MQKNMVKKLLMLSSLIFAVLMIVLDGTLMNVSMVAIAKDLSITISDLQFLITTYSLVMGALMLIGGKLGDILGRKKMFISGAVLFTLGSFLAATSRSSLQLFIGWSVIEGIGAALMMPASTSIIVNTFKGKDRALAFGLWGGIAAAGAALGPIIGGYFTTNFSWRYAFFIQVFLGILVIATSVLLKESRPAKGKKFDFGGAILASTGVASLVYALLKANKFGWIFAKESVSFLGVSLNLFGLSATPLFFMVGLVLLILFLWYETKIKDPLLDVDVFKNKAFMAGVFVASMLNLAQAGMFFVVPVYLQVLWGLNAIQTGVYLLPLTIGALLGSATVARSNIDSRKLIRTGIILSIVGIALLWWAMDTTLLRYRFILAFSAIGLGIGLVMAKLTNIIMSAVKPSEAGEASGLNATLRRLGSSLGTAIIGTIFFTKTENDIGDMVADIANKYPNFEGLVSKLPKNIDVRIFANMIKNLPDQLRNIFWPGFTDIFVDASRYTMIWAGVFMVLVLISTIWLKKIER